MALGWSVCHAFRHRIRLRPDNIASEPPAIGAQGKSDHPGDTDKVFGFDVVRCGIISVWIDSRNRARMVDFRNGRVINFAASAILLMSELQNIAL